MRAKNLRDALGQFFTERSLQILAEEVDKLLCDWNDVLLNEPNCAHTNERIAVLSALLMALE